ncbi:hypothetical protein HDU85_005824 [Gaertneriomyces sp. JEL0708]|nr:hypothetical protein HDU85_005824 [Gaertneriomyces sp. JEL0708]
MGVEDDDWESELIEELFDGGVEGDARESDGSFTCGKEIGLQDNAALWGVEGREEV